MTSSGVTLSFPLQVTFRKVDAPREAELWICSEAAKLGAFYGRIMGCRVAVEGQHRHRYGGPYHVRIDLTVPRGELVIKQNPASKTRARQLGEAELRKHLETRNPHKHLRQAISDAFQVAGRRLEDYVRRQRGDVKHRDLAPVARVNQLLRDKGYGFLVTPEGREIYFHKDSVLNRGFGRLKVGSTVVFSEEQGDRGPQASSVRLTARHGLRQIARRPAA